MATSSQSSSTRRRRTGLQNVSLEPPAQSVDEIGDDCKNNTIVLNGDDGNLNKQSKGPPPVSSVLRCRQRSRDDSRRTSSSSSSSSSSGSPPLEDVRKMSEQSFRNFLDCFRRQKHRDINEFKLQVSLSSIKLKHLKWVMLGYKVFFCCEGTSISNIAQFDTHVFTN